VTTPDQLSLDLGGMTAGPLLPRRIPLMTPARGDGPFDDEGWFFEPWWPGSPALARVEDGRLRLVIDHLADPTPAFPELAGLPAQLRGGADGTAIAGTLLVLDAEGRPDPDLLRLRLADPGRRLGTGAFVASDVPWVDGTSLAAWPFAQRRARLLELLPDGDHAMAGRGLRGEGTTLAAAVASMGLRELAARRLSARWTAVPAPDAFLRLPVLAPAASETRPLLVLLRRLPLDEDGLVG
jgi:bifunctional non-homologous end joining protein LigD